MDWRILYNPLAVLRRDVAFIASLVVVVVLTGVAWWAGVHLDGALDLHVVPTSPSAGLIIAESLIAWLSLGLFLFAASRLFGGNSGVGMHLAAAGLARFPYILVAIIGSKPLLGGAMLNAIKVGQQEIVVRPQDLITPALIIGSLIMLGLIIWSIVMLYLGYKEASRLQGGKVVGSFVIGLLLAEVVSKVIIIWLMRLGV